MATVIITTGTEPTSAILGATTRRKSRARARPVVPGLGRVVRVHRDAAGNVARAEIEVG